MRFTVAFCRICSYLHYVVVGCAKQWSTINGNCFRYYRALESVSIASALSTALTIYPCQIRVHRWQSLNSNFLQFGRSSGGRPQRAVHPIRLPVNTVIHTTLVGLEPATFRSFFDCWSDAPPTHQIQYSCVMFRYFVSYWCTGNWTFRPFVSSSPRRFYPGRI